MPTNRTRRRDAGRPRGQPVTDAVLAATLHELATEGVDGLSIERIARHADVHKTTVYRRWPTRAALVAAALERIADGLATQAPDTGSLRGDLVALLTRLASFLEQPAGRAVARAALSNEAAAEVGALAARRLGRSAAGATHPLVQRALERGEWRDGVPAEHVVNTLVGALLHRALLEQDALDPAWLEGVVDVVVDGVAPRTVVPG